ncbi:MAG: response regulator [Chloroherpetonaceae bacterium]|nr:response regulator [Chloroherpetonaceae bacterium]
MMFSAASPGDVPSGKGASGHSYVSCDHDQSPSACAVHAPSLQSSRSELSPCYLSSDQKRILIVDDYDRIRDIMERILRRYHYQVFTAPSAEVAWEMLRFASFDLIISDMMMSGMNGLELTAHVSQAYPHIPIVLLTALRDRELLRTAIRCGASDFLAKPFSIEDVPLIVERNLERHALLRFDRVRRDYTLKFNTVKVLTAAVEAKEPYTAEHSRRVTHLAVNLGQAMGLPEEELRHLEIAAQVHDVGKIGIPDFILHKPGPLTEEEWAEIRKHPEKGAEIVGHVEELAYVAEVVRHHHERVDGSGYPSGLQGDNIPLLSRVIAVADAFEVMTSDRVYRRRFSREEACCRLQSGAGTQFDRAIVDTFLARHLDTLLT